MSACMLFIAHKPQEHPQVLCILKSPCSFVKFHSLYVLPIQYIKDLDNHYQCCSDCVRVASWLQLLRMGSGPSNIAALLCRALQAQQHCRCAQCTFSAMACSVCCIGTSPTNRSMCCCPVQSATVPSKMQHQNTYTEPILLSQSMETVSGSCCSARAPLKVFCLHPGHLHSAVICSQARLCRSWFRYWDQVGLCGCSTFIAVLLCHGDSSTTQILLPQS